MSTFCVSQIILASITVFITLFLVIFITLSILSPTCHRIPRIPFRYYLSMIAWTILISIFSEELKKLFTNCKSQNLNAFVLIIAITSFHYIVICIKLVLKGDKKTLVYSAVENDKKAVITLLIEYCFFVFSISAILLLIYTQLSKSLFGSGGDSTGSSGFDLAICAAIIAAFATIYNVQRVSKQELTKNRQDWITTVRLETAKIISTFDSFKANYNIIYTQFYNTNHDKFISSCKSLVRSCTKLRMFLNPGDTIAPMITIQLDAIINYCNSWLNKTDSSKIPTIQSINKVNLHESLMPWVLVLLKAEWERVKDVLESREETSDGFYSESVYKNEWDKERLKKYGIKVKNSSKDDIIKALFRGFKFCEKDNKEYYDIISQKLEQLGLVDEQDSGTS